MTPRGILGLCCVCIAQLMTHTAIYTIPFTLQLCYKPLVILQWVTKSQKVHISSHDGFYTRTKKNFFIFVCNRLLLILKKVIENWFCNNITVQAKIPFEMDFY